MKKHSNSGKKSEPRVKPTKSRSTGHRETKEVLAELVGRLRKKLNQKVAAAGSAEVQGRDGPEPNLDRLTVGVDLGDQSSNSCILDLGGETLVEGQLRTTPQDFAEFFQSHRDIMRAVAHINPRGIRVDDLQTRVLGLQSSSPLLSLFPVSSQPVACRHA